MDASTQARIDFLEELRWRGLLHQATDEPGLQEHLREGTRRAYCGFDPTADSLTIGNLVPIITLVHFARAGHEPVVVMGGGTGLIGDPSGKSAERQLRTAEEVAQNVDRQRDIFRRVFENAGMPEPRILNNYDWLKDVSFLEMLRDVGKYLSVNMMIQKDSVKDRLHNREQGISYTEFSYMILQAYDFAHLHKTMTITLQLGGSDQWGNIVVGADLIRKLSINREAAQNNPDYVISGDIEPTRPEIGFGLTVPLVTKADGGKFGKTESGAVWLTAPVEGDGDESRSRRTSAFAMHQFWLNTADADVGRFLRVFTLLSREEIERLEAEHAAAPHKRVAQRALAHHATALVHGEAEALAAEQAAAALFSGDIRALPKQTLFDAMHEAPSSGHRKSELAGEGVALLDLLIETGLAKSKREAREFLEGGSVSVNGEKADANRRLTESDLLHGEAIALRRGKKQWHLTRWA